MINKRILGNICICLGLILILGAGGLYLYNLHEASAASASSEHVVESLLAEMQTLEAKDLGDGLYSADGRISGIMTEEDLYNQMEGNIDYTMDTIEVEGHSYIGVLTLPTLSLELPVMTSWSYPSLRIAPCRYVGTVRSNDLVIAAHNYLRHFGGLKDLSIGDEVAFTDVHNVTTVYEVAEVEVLQPTAVESMVFSDYDLSLFTCTYGGRTRFTVRCVRKR